jgi:hypothetical protein
MVISPMQRSTRAAEEEKDSATEGVDSGAMTWRGDGRLDLDTLIIVGWC